MRYMEKENIICEGIKDYKGTFATSVVIQRKKRIRTLEGSKIPLMQINSSSKVSPTKKIQQFSYPVERTSIAQIENSNFNRLKRQVERLEQEDQLGTIQRFSTLENPESTRVNESAKFMTINKTKKVNQRKIAKGRPQIYNWVRKNNRKLAEFQDNYKKFYEYKKNKELSLPSKKHHQGTFMERLKKIEENRKLNSNHITPQIRAETANPSKKVRTIKNQI